MDGHVILCLTKLWEHVDGLDLLGREAIPEPDGVVVRNCQDLALAVNVDGHDVATVMALTDFIVEVLAALVLLRPGYEADFALPATYNHPVLGL